MKRICLYILMALFAVSCTDDGQVDTTVATRVYMPSSGLQEVTPAMLLADTYKLYLYKGGYNDESLTVTLAVEEKLIAQYNAAHKTDYQLLPAQYYTFQTQVWLGPKLIKNFTAIKFDLPAMGTILKQGNYLLPITISSPTDESLNLKSRSVLINLHAEQI